MAGTEPKDRRILVVDDDEELRDLLEILLRTEGFQVATAEDGEEALRLAKEASFDLAFTDLMMPAGGFELLRRLREAAPGLPVVVLTGRRMDPLTEQMIRGEGNVRDFCLKPVRPAAITALVHGLLGTRPGG